MRYQLNITLLEEDYFAFNYFHAVEAPQQSDQLRRNRIVFICMGMILLLMAIFLFGPGSPFFLYGILFGGFLVVYSLFMKKFAANNIRSRIAKMKEAGKLPYSQQAQVIFEEDKVIEVTPGARTEESYDLIDVIYVLPDRYVYIYTNSMRAYTLPIPQLQAQLDLQEFLEFLSTKCQKIEYC